MDEELQAILAGCDDWEVDELASLAEEMIREGSWQQ